MKYNLKPDPNTHTGIMKKYPDAVILMDHIKETGELNIGDQLVNHERVPPTIVTEKMLEEGFPMLHEAYYFYIIKAK